MSLFRAARREVGRQYRHHGNFSRALDRLNRLPLLREFVEGQAEVPVFATREAMWDHVAGLEPTAIDYLEFGVHQGHSLSYWARTNRDPRSRFFGFDTFRGLPEHWKRDYPQGYFDLGGKEPQIDDPRVCFVKGLFQQRLDAFLAAYDPAGRPQIIHIDCDLYSSTLYCLTRLDPILKRGTIVIFDEFGDVQHEFRAFNDYCASYRRVGELLCAHDDFFTVGVRMHANGTRPDKSS